MKDTNNQGQTLQERLSEAEERWKNATISDIIAEKRREADSIEQSARGSFKVGESCDDIPFTDVDLDRALDHAAQIRKEADHLEAALRRELSKMCPKTGGDFGQFGNGAKCREALEKCANWGEQIDCQLGSSDATVYAFRHERCLAHNISECARAALAAPARNCDVGTVEEQKERLDAFCEEHQCIYCPLVSKFECRTVAGVCTLGWAQMPYEKGESDGDK